MMARSAALAEWPGGHLGAEVIAMRAQSGVLRLRPGCGPGAGIAA
jgi:hypothetical protein